MRAARNEKVLKERVHISKWVRAGGGDVAALAKEMKVDKAGRRWITPATSFTTLKAFFSDFRVLRRRSHLW